MMKIERHCEHCNTLFEPPRTDAKYCTQKCKVAAYRKRISLGQTPQPASTAIMNTKTLVAPEALPVSAKFIVDELTRQRDKLETTIESQAKKIETLTQEKSALQKELETAQNEVNQKPSALAGFFSDREAVKDTLAGAIELIKTLKEPGPQVGTLQENNAQAAPSLNPQEMALVQWFKVQPPAVAQGMIDIMNSLATNQDKAAELIAYFKRSMMGAGVKVANG